MPRAEAAKRDPVKPRDFPRFWPRFGGANNSNQLYAMIGMACRLQAARIKPAGTPDADGGPSPPRARATMIVQIANVTRGWA